MFQWDAMVENSKNWPVDMNNIDYKMTVLNSSPQSSQRHQMIPEHWENWHTELEVW